MTLQDATLELPASQMLFNRNGIHTSTRWVDAGEVWVDACRMTRGWIARHENGSRVFIRESSSALDRKGHGTRCFSLASMEDGLYEASTEGGTYSEDRHFFRVASHQIVAVYADKADAFATTSAGAR